MRLRINHLQNSDERTSGSTGGVPAVAVVGAYDASGGSRGAKPSSEPPNTTFGSGGSRIVELPLFFVERARAVELSLTLAPTLQSEPALTRSDNIV